jgi:flagellar basal-body rod protein FlgB
MTGTAMSSTAISTSGFTSGIDLFNVADQRMAWLNTRQSVLAQNIANASTPGWKERDVGSFASVLASTTGITPTRTSAMHLQGTATVASGAHIVRGENAPDGNAVAIDEQMIKVAQTETDHQTATAIYGKYLGMFRMALGH